MYLKSSFWVGPNWPYIRNITMTSYIVVSLVEFSYWSKFHGNIITGSEVMTIFA